MSTLSSIWVLIKFCDRKAFLEQYYRTDLSVKKHLFKAYSELPINFKKYFKSKILEFVMLNVKVII